jgi:hypothetical protein
VPPRRLPSPRAVPWAILLEVALAMRRHWDRLTPGERAELTRILRESRGNPRNVAPRDRAELRTIVRKLEPAVMARDLLPYARRMRGGKQRFRSF